jgi:hypothetical protein
MTICFPLHTDFHHSIDFYPLAHIGSLYTLQASKRAVLSIESRMGTIDFHIFPINVLDRRNLSFRSLTDYEVVGGHSGGSPSKDMGEKLIAILPHLEEMLWN